MTTITPLAPPHQINTITARTTADLRAILGDLPGELLFRGQIRHYDNNGVPSIQTSFDRHGCIPETMLHWSRYADNVLDVFYDNLTRDLHFNHALLQHYGWRSFFIDCSSSASVAAWFGSHRYSEKRVSELCEDYQERPVILQKRMAQFIHEEGEGHLYVFDRQLAHDTVGAIDLNVLTVKTGAPRTDLQKAWLIGPFGRKSLPSEVFVAHIVAERSVLRRFAADEGFCGTDTLFPPKEDDPILAALLGLPWKSKQPEHEQPFPIPIFRRALEVPEYQESFTKRSPSSVAFFQRKRIAEFIGTIDGASEGCAIYNVPSQALFGSTPIDTPLRFPEVQNLLRDNKCVAFEVDDLIQHANMGEMTLYQKGIAVWAHQDDLIEVMELMVRHPGLDMTGASFLPGWHYRVGIDGLWTRELRVDDCACGKSWPHERHISSLHIVERFLHRPDSSVNSAGLNTH